MRSALSYLQERQWARASEMCACRREQCGLGRLGCESELHWMGNREPRHGMGRAGDSGNSRGLKVPLVPELVDLVLGHRRHCAVEVGAHQCHQRIPVNAALGGRVVRNELDNVIDDVGW